LPINQPRVPIHNNNRDGAAQMFIPLNTAAYSPNTLNNGSPRQANQTTGRGFFTAPNRSASGNLVRAVSSSFADVWSQPRLFFNSLTKVEQQFVINAIRFETSQLKSSVVKSNVLIQLNRVSHDIAVRVASVLGMTAPDADPTYYHDNTTKGVGVVGEPLLKLDGLKVGYLTHATAFNNSSPSGLQSALANLNVDLVIVADSLAEGVSQTYSATDASAFDALVIADGAESLFASNSSSTLFPAARPLQILQDSFRWGKPVAAVGSGSKAFEAAGIKTGAKGVYTATDSEALASDLEEGLKEFKFLDRFPLDK
jgi:catalase